MTSVKQLWIEHASLTGKGQDYLTVNESKFPPNYKFIFNWAVTQLAPVVLDNTQDGLWNERKFFKELFDIFSKRASSVLERIRAADKQKAKRIEDLLKRAKDEAPSDELLGLYSTYKRTVDDAEDAYATDKEKASSILDGSDAQLQQIGKRFNKVLYAGKAVLYDVEADGWTYYEDCKKHFGHLKIELLNPMTGKPQLKNAFSAFEEWDKAPRYDRVVFNPRHDGHYDTNFNLWQGMSVVPEAGNEDMLLWELLMKICDNNEEYFEYVQKWLAHMIQKPWELPGTALGISGPQGLGKNTIWETIGMLLSSVASIIKMRDDIDSVVGNVLGTGAFGYFTSYNHVFGEFNAIAGNKTLLFLDEATWGGGHVQKAQLKTAITGPTVLINDKNMRHLTVPNYRRFVFASNEAFYYGADADDRRLLPLEFKDKHRPSKEWFNSFYAARKNGKMLQNLLYRLKNIDIKDWQPMQALRAINIVTGQAIQQSSIADYQQWLDDIAETGKMIIPGDREHPELSIPVCDEFVDEDQLRRSYQLYTNQHDMKGWNKPEFKIVRDNILGQKKQKRCGRGRNMPSQLEMQRRLDAQYSWTRTRFTDIDIVEEHLAKVESSKVYHLAKVLPAA